MQWPLRIRWRRRSRPPMPVQTAQALRYLYVGYQKQRRMWVYIVLTSLMLMSLFILLSLFMVTDPWGIAIPMLGIVFSVFQLYRCKDLGRVIRQALIIQQQIDKARAEIERQKEAEQQEETEGPEPREDSSNGHGGSPENGLDPPEA